MNILQMVAISIIMLCSQATLALDFSGSGEEYLAHISSSDAYMQGVATGTAATILSILYYEGIVCTPKKVTTEEFTSVIRKFLKDNPQRLHEQIYVLGADALLVAFPCEDPEVPL